MRLAPIIMDAILRLAAATLVPIVPLFLTLTPLEDVVKMLLGISF